MSIEQKTRLNYSPESILDESSTSAAHGHSPLRRFLVWGLPAAFTLGWILYVFLGGHLDRVVDNWRAALTRFTSQ